MIGRTRPSGSCAGHDAPIGTAREVCVLEVGIAVALLALLGATGIVLVVPPETLVVTGFWVAAGGLAFGVPTGLVYHLMLRRALLHAGCLPARWWWQPTALHPSIPSSERWHVLAWCGAGATGFAVSLLGCVVVAIGAIRIS